MATTIVTKNSSLALTASSAGQLVQGELAVNVTDRKLYTLDGGGNVVQIADGGSPYVLPVSITVNSATTALIVSQAGAGGGVRITNTGAGNSLLVEDEANPDSTPLVINSVGNLVAGYTSTVPTVNYTGAGIIPLLQVQGPGASVSSAGLYNWSSSTSSSSTLAFSKSISNATGTRGTLTAASTDLGNITFSGDDGTSFVASSSIRAETDAVPTVIGAGPGKDMPGRLLFSTTAVGGTVPTERFRINSSGALGIAGANFGTAGQAFISAGSAAAPVWTTQYLSISFIMDGGGAVITTGIKGDLTIPFACTIAEWTLLADQSGSMVVDIWKDTYANYPPTVADTITGSTKPTISAAAKGQSSTLTGWTATIAAGDTLRFNVDSCSTITRVTLSLKVYRT